MNDTQMQTLTRYMSLAHVLCSQFPERSKQIIDGCDLLLKDERCASFPELVNAVCIVDLENIVVYLRGALVFVIADEEQVKHSFKRLMCEVFADFARDGIFEERNAMFRLNLVSLARKAV